MSVVLTHKHYITNRKGSIWVDQWLLYGWAIPQEDFAEACRILIIKVENFDFDPHKNFSISPTQRLKRMQES